MTSTFSSVISTDICIIGGGSGGLSVAAGAVQMGAEVTLIEKAEMGGDLPQYRMHSLKSATGGCQSCLYS
jgi:glycine/D-amino acid oxidase-like deaminating enzyme